MQAPLSQVSPRLGWARFDELLLSVDHPTSWEWGACVLRGDSLSQSRSLLPKPSRLSGPGVREAGPGSGPCPWRPAWLPGPRHGRRCPRAAPAGPCSERGPGSRQGAQAAPAPLPHGRRLCPSTGAPRSSARRHIWASVPGSGLLRTRERGAPGAGPAEGNKDL